MKAKRTIATRRSNYQVKRVDPVMVGSDMQARLFTSRAPRRDSVLEGEPTIMTRKLKRAKKIWAEKHYQIAPGTSHPISNRLGTDCRFLLLQGVGKCDWIKAGSDDGPSALHV